MRIALVCTPHTDSNLRLAGYRMQGRLFAIGFMRGLLDAIPGG